MEAQVANICLNLWNQQKRSSRVVRTFLNTSIC